MTTVSDRRYLPGMGKDWMLPLYDPFTRWIGIQAAHARLADQAELATAGRVLEIGCGTGNLTLLLKRRRPALEVVGLDPDPKALARAERKARRAGVALELDRGFADEMPYGDATFDRVLSSLMFHHLDGEARLGSLKEVARVLRPGGSLHLLDFSGEVTGMHGLVGRLTRRSHRLDDNGEERIRTLMWDAGLTGPVVVDRLGTHFGEVIYYQARA